MQLYTNGQLANTFLLARGNETSWEQKVHH